MSELVPPAAVDYLRLATWEDAAYMSASAAVARRVARSPKRAKWLQYVGNRFGDVFIGRAEQNGKAHTVVQVSGATSDDFYEMFLSEEHFYCSRIDLQITVEQPAWVQLRWVRDQLEAENVTLIESKNDTLYIGSRESDVFIRLYEKKLDSNYLRLEFELKGSRAKRAWYIMSGGVEPGAIFSAYLAKTPLPADIEHLFCDRETVATQQALRQELAKDQAKKLAWFLSLDECVKRMLADHDLNDHVFALVKSWYRWGQTQDLQS